MDEVSLDELIPDEKSPSYWKDRLLESHFPWEAAQQVLMPDFLEKYTVADSYSIAFLLGIGGEGTLLLGWDTFWTDGRVPDSSDGTNPTLLIRFSNIYKFSGDGLFSLIGQCMGDADSRAADESELAHVTEMIQAQRRLDRSLPEQLLSRGVYHTTFYPCLMGDNSSFEILHDGPVQVLCVSQSGETYRLPDLD